MYITFSYDQKGNFQISERVLKSIVRSIVMNFSRCVTIEKIITEIINGSNIYFNICVLADVKNENYDFKTNYIYDNIKETILDLLSFEPKNIAITLTRKQ